MMTLTGSLGDVMKESARIAFSVVKTLIDRNKITIDKKLIPLFPNEKEKKITPSSNEIYHRFDLHVHVPEGATPKDGPSAGITMAIALYSLALEKPVRHDLAMTGELTLKGKIMPIGGVKEKTIAAKRVGIKNLVFPEDNREDFDQLQDSIKDGIKPYFVSEFKEVVDLCF